MSLKITQHHTADHNWLRDGILAESDRLATPVDIGGPYKLGDPAHIQEHNRTTVALQTLADAAGCAVVLPPVRALGDVGHKEDHLAWEQALAQIQITEGWNDATGGTVTEVSDERGFRWRVHTFTSSGTFTVKRNLRPFDILAIGHGGPGGPDVGSGGGGAGGFFEQFGQALDVKAYQVTLGAGTQLVDVTPLVPDGGNGANEEGGRGGSGGGGGHFSGPGRGVGGPGIPPYGYNGGYAAYSQSYAAGGGGGGAGGPGQDQIAEFSGGEGGPGRSSVIITGTPVEYARGGQSSARDRQHGAPATRYGDGGGGTGGAGFTGVLAIRYQVAPYNEATGGTVTDYTKDGKRYRCHAFQTPGDFTVTVAAKPFRVLAVGGGTNGAQGEPYCKTGGRGAWGEPVAQMVPLTAGTFPVALGSGAPTTFHTITAKAGTNTPRIESDIEGTTKTYPAAGGPDGPCGSDGNQRGGAGTWPGGEGGGGGGIGNESPFQPGPGGAGAAGGLFITYEIASN